MQWPLIFILEIFIFSTIFDEILCGDKKTSVVKPIKSYNLNGRKLEIGTTSNVQKSDKMLENVSESQNLNVPDMMPVQEVPMQKSKMPIDSTENGSKNQNLNGSDEMPKLKAPIKNSKFTLKKENNEADPTSIIQKTPMKLMPCHRNQSKFVKTTQISAKTEDQEGQKQKVPSKTTNKPIKNTTDQKSRLLTKSNKSVKSLSKSADFEDKMPANANKQNVTLMRQTSKSMDLKDEYLQIFKEIRRKKKKSEQYQNLIIKKPDSSINPLDSVKMGKQKQRFALRQAQDKNPLIQQNKLAKGKNIASSSKQSDERKPKIDRTRKYGKNSSKPDKSVPSKEVKSEKNSSKNEDLESQEMLEDPRAFLLKNLHLNKQKIPNTENENVNNIISESLKQYEINREKFVESMEKILQTSSKDFVIDHQINQFNMDIDLKIESLKSIDELTPIQLFATRDWLHLMKKDLDYMHRSLIGRKNLMVAASKVN